LYVLVQLLQVHRLAELSWVELKCCLSVIHSTSCRALWRQTIQCQQKVGCLGGGWTFCQHLILLHKEILKARNVRIAHFELWIPLNRLNTGGTMMAVRICQDVCLASVCFSAFSLLLFLLMLLSCRQWIWRWHADAKMYSTFSFKIFKHFGTCVAFIRIYIVCIWRVQTVCTIMYTDAQAHTTMAIKQTIAVRLYVARYICWVCYFELGGCRQLISASSEEIPKMQGPILILLYLLYLLCMYMSLLLVVTTKEWDPWQWKWTSFTSFNFLVECSAEFCPLPLRHPGEAREVLMLSSYDIHGRTVSILKILWVLVFWWGRGSLAVLSWFPSIKTAKR
jgi:hypothetical protein